MTTVSKAFWTGIGIALLVAVFIFQQISWQNERNEGAPRTEQGVSPGGADYYPGGSNW